MPFRPIFWPVLAALTLSACAEGGGYRVVGASASFDTSRGLATSTYDERGSFEIVDGPQDGEFFDEEDVDEGPPPPRRRR